MNLWKSHHSIVSVECTIITLLANHFVTLEFNNVAVRVQVRASNSDEGMSQKDHAKTPLAAIIMNHCYILWMTNRVIYMAFIMNTDWSARTAFTSLLNSLNDLYADKSSSTHLQEWAIGLRAIPVSPLNDRGRRWANCRRQNCPYYKPHKKRELLLWEVPHTLQ